MQQFRQQTALVGLRHHVNELVDALGRGRLRYHFNALRLGEQAVGELGHVLRHGGREQQCLAAGRQSGGDLADVADEAHVEHAVGFVEHKELNRRQGYMALVHQIEQAARRGDNKVDATAHHGNLRCLADAAENHGRAERQMAAIGLDAVADLHGELARRREDERPH